MAFNRYKTGGWFKDNLRHYLAAKYGRAPNKYMLRLRTGKPYVATPKQFIPGKQTPPVEEMLMTFSARELPPDLRTEWFQLDRRGKEIQRDLRDPTLGAEMQKRLDAAKKELQYAEDMGNLEASERLNDEIKQLKDELSLGKMKAELSDIQRRKLEILGVLGTKYPAGFKTLEEMQQAVYPTKLGFTGEPGKMSYGEVQMSGGEPVMITEELFGLPVKDTGMKTPLVVKKFTPPSVEGGPQDIVESQMRIKLTPAEQAKIAGGMSREEIENIRLATAIRLKALDQQRRERLDELWEKFKMRPSVDVTPGGAVKVRELYDVEAFPPRKVIGPLEVGIPGVRIGDLAVGRVMRGEPDPRLAAFRKVSEQDPQLEDLYEKMSALYMPYAKERPLGGKLTAVGRSSLSQAPTKRGGTVGQDVEKARAEAMRFLQQSATQREMATQPYYFEVETPYGVKPVFKAEDVDPTGRLKRMQEAEEARIAAREMARRAKRAEKELQQAGLADTSEQGGASEFVTLSGGSRIPRMKGPE